MPSLERNLIIWGKSPWRWEGHEWSEPWGSAADQWHNTILPRIYQFLPSQRILEIGFGYGRWASYLINNCSEYVGVDITEKCVDYCGRTFGSFAARAKFLLGDGMSVQGVPDNSISFAFSFDSLVHVEMDCMTANIAELARVLQPGGTAFLHHSNLGEYTLATLGGRRTGSRGPTVTAERVKAEFCARGFRSIAHEKLAWIFEDGAYIDCFTMVAKPLAGQSVQESGGAEAIFYNDKFYEEITRSKWISERWGNPRPKLTGIEEIKAAAKKRQATA